MPTVHIEVDGHVGLSPTLGNAQHSDTLPEFDAKGMTAAGHALMMDILFLVCVWHARHSRSQISNQHMPRTRVTEAGNLKLQSDGGLAALILSDQPPVSDPSIAAASLFWSLFDDREFAVGDLVTHSEHGIARYIGRKKIESAIGTR